jgi:hypothetical protein
MRQGPPSRPKYLDAGTAARIECHTGPTSVGGWQLCGFPLLRDMPPWNVVPLQTLCLGMAGTRSGGTFYGNHETTSRKFWKRQAGKKRPRQGARQLTGEPESTAIGSIGPFYNQWADSIIDSTTRDKIANHFMQVRAKEVAGTPATLAEVLQGPSTPLTKATG